MSVSMAPSAIRERIAAADDRRERGDNPGNSGKRAPRKPAARLSDDEILAMAGVEKRFSTGEVADMFGKSTQWLYWGLKEENGYPFRHPDGTPVDPERVGEGEHGRRRFTAEECRAIARSSYLRGNLPEDELAQVLRRILVAEKGESAFAKSRRKKAQ